MSFCLKEQRGRFSHFQALPVSFHRALDDVVRKGYRSGTHRVIAPAETIRNFGRLKSAMGITRIANITGLDNIGIPVVVVTRPNSRMLAVSQGKGLELDAAKASGLMEAAEGYHAEHINLPLRLGSVEDLTNVIRLVDVDQLQRSLSSPFHNDLPLLWIEGFDILQQEPVWVPYEMVHANYTINSPAGECFASNTNGLSSGNNLLEAVSYGISEVVERDATMLWQLENEDLQQRTRIDLDTVNDPACRKILSMYEKAAVSVAVWETTSNISIPSFLCRITDATEDIHRILYPAEGMGCHPVRHVALLRALTEAAQCRLTEIAGSRDDCFWDEYERLRNPDFQRYARSLLKGGETPMRFVDGPSGFDADTFDEEIEWELRQLQSVGINSVVIVDLSKTEIGIPVVRVIIPGLEGQGVETAGRIDYVPGARAQALIDSCNENIHFPG